MQLVPRPRRLVVARSSTEAWPGEKGFVGGTVDQSIGLTQLGARSYDAELGRFISVDR